MIRLSNGVTLLVIAMLSGMTASARAQQESATAAGRRASGPPRSVGPVDGKRRLHYARWNALRLSERRALALSGRAPSS